MSDSFLDELEGLIGKHRQIEADKERDEATEERFKRIETGFDRLGGLIEERLPKDSPPHSNSEESAGDKGEGKPTASGNEPPPAIEEDDVEVERVTHFNVPRIYTGDDEPEIVRYIDADTGEEKTRKGRRKNRPVGYDVEIVAEQTTIENEGVPTEPDEESG